MAADLYATLSGELASGEFGSGDGFLCPEQKFEQSLPLCIGLSAFGGLLEVTSTMCLAYPEYKTKLGYTYTACQMRLRGWHRGHRTIVLSHVCSIC